MSEPLDHVMDGIGMLDPAEVEDRRALQEIGRAVLNPNLVECSESVAAMVKVTVDAALSRLHPRTRAVIESMVTAHMIEWEMSNHRGLAEPEGCRSVRQSMRPVLEALALLRPRVAEYRVHDVLHWLVRVEAECALHDGEEADRFLKERLHLRSEKRRPAYRQALWDALRSGTWADVDPSGRETHYWIGGGNGRRGKVGSGEFPKMREVRHEGGDPLAYLRTDVFRRAKGIMADWIKEERRSNEWRALLAEPGPDAEERLRAFVGIPVRVVDDRGHSAVNSDWNEAIEVVRSDQAFARRCEEVSTILDELEAAGLPEPQRAVACNFRARLKGQDGTATYSKSAYQTLLRKIRTRLSAKAA